MVQSLRSSGPKISSHSAGKWSNAVFHNSGSTIRGSSLTIDPASGGKERVLENVDYLFAQWVQPSANTAAVLPASTDNLGRGTAASPDSKGGVGDEKESKIRLLKLDEEFSALATLEELHEIAGVDIKERLQNIIDRLKKRKNGWLEIDDRALRWSSYFRRYRK
ncbi:MAG: hypothetical protein M1839_008035 [Geoglossum umbratile]|nr:MAG: hypothetical protein M1839_008035 [Geoglossum umbratile]